MTSRLDDLRAMRAFLDREIAAELGPELEMGAKNPTVQAVADLYDVDPEHIVGGVAGHRVAAARHAIAWLLRSKGSSLAEIAAYLHYSDRSVAWRACRRIDRDPAAVALLRGLKVGT